jgi:hypothetical protein
MLKTLLVRENIENLKKARVKVLVNKYPHKRTLVCILP